MEPDPVDWDSIARAFDPEASADGDARGLLRGQTILFDGFGSIARPASEELARRGAARFVVTDPKEYVADSIPSQCNTDEVGRGKVDVGAERLRKCGAHVTSYARDIASVPEGVIEADSIVVTTVDNRRADIVSNRRTARMRARLVKVNVEPTLGVVAVRAYDFREFSPLCVECQFGEHHYAAQRHPKSCDAVAEVPTSERRTNSPRWLSQVAAQITVLAVLDLAVDGPAAHGWLGHERQYRHATDMVTTSRLEANPNCRWNHAERWPNLVRLGENETTMTLRELFWAAEIEVDARAKIRFCQQIALRGRCPSCRVDVAVVRWIVDSQAPLGICPNCGTSLLPVPFSVFAETSTEPLLGVMDKRLGEWGVEHSAVIEISRDDRRVSFVVGDP